MDAARHLPSGRDICRVCAPESSRGFGCMPHAAACRGACDSGNSIPCSILGGSCAILAGIPFALPVSSVCLLMGWLKLSKKCPAVGALKITPGRALLAYRPPWKRPGKPPGGIGMPSVVVSELACAQIRWQMERGGCAFMPVEGPFHRPQPPSLKNHPGLGCPHQGGTFQSCGRPGWDCRKRRIRRSHKKACHCVADGRRRMWAFSNPSRFRQSCIIPV